MSQILKFKFSDNNTEIKSKVIWEHIQKMKPKVKPKTHPIGGTGKQADQNNKQKLITSESESQFA